jgi:hypothetical protein
MPLGLGGGAKTTEALRLHGDLGHFLAEVTTSPIYPERRVRGGGRQSPLWALIPVLL